MFPLLEIRDSNADEEPRCVIAQTPAIAQYLGEAVSIGGKNAEQRAQVTALIDFLGNDTNTKMFSLLTDGKGGIPYTPAGDDALAIVGKALRTVVPQLSGCFGRVEAWLSAHPGGFVLGEELTAADYWLLAVGDAWRVLDLPI